ncbi:DUF2235 domain-containing protein [uncultured Desulfuromonas sp.]|uniref:DUF2235 domain-containing protein n=1 Tax=uncultured Desulfuromonas sp. TaxID=181013 RepID=UPI002AAAA0CD|nr:DUF2235 domain-containing protein [uncultured Desulfuromonas sp.]
MANLIFCFDGTCNDVEDAAQGETPSGGTEDTNMTNVLKLHLLLGGDLQDGQHHFDDQLSLYYPGVGTYGRKLKRIFNAALALTDVGRIITGAKEDLRQHYQQGDNVFVFGFSRGAAIARRFCSVISQDAEFSKVRIALLGVFDTVASFGMPDLSEERRPNSDVLFEDCTLASNIDQAVHLVSINDRRKAFQPTLMNDESKVTEVWFAGAHSDVGGGYRRDGLSDITLQFLLDEIECRDLGLKKLAANQIRFDTLTDGGDKADIQLDDVLIEPNAFGVNHEQTRLWPISMFTLYDRHVTRIKNDRVVADPRPVVHYTVAERIYGDSDYRPVGLRRPHTILNVDGSLSDFDNLAHHLEVGMRPLTPLRVGAPYTVPVFAHQLYNRTGLMLEKGKRYQFTVSAERTWRDASIECDGDGWDRDHPDIRWFKDVGVAIMEPFRRFAEAQWFALIGAVGDKDDELFVIGQAGTQYTPETSGEFCPFANDLKRMYGNNDGFLYVTVERLD